MSIIINRVILPKNDLLRLISCLENQTDARGGVQIVCLGVLDVSVCRAYLTKEMIHDRLFPCLATGVIEAVDLS